jgi:hypothetical protein
MTGIPGLEQSGNGVVRQVAGVSPFVYGVNDEIGVVQL